jgi:hypothetical protein
MSGCEDMFIRADRELCSASSFRFLVFGCRFLCVSGISPNFYGDDQLFSIDLRHTGAGLVAPS